MEAKIIFDKYPNLQLLYVTADGQYFIKEHHAQNHAKTLQNKQIKEIRKDADEGKKAKK